MPKIRKHIPCRNQGLLILEEKFAVKEFSTTTPVNAADIGRPPVRRERRSVPFWMTTTRISQLLTRLRAQASPESANPMSASDPGSGAWCRTQSLVQFGVPVVLSGVVPHRNVTLLTPVNPAVKKPLRSNVTGPSR